MDDKKAKVIELRKQNLSPSFFGFTAKMLPVHFEVAHHFLPYVYLT